MMTSQEVIIVPMDGHANQWVLLYPLICEELENRTFQVPSVKSPGTDFLHSINKGHGDLFSGHENAALIYMALLMSRAAGALATLFTEQSRGVKEPEKVTRTPCSATPVNVRSTQPSCLEKRLLWPLTRVLMSSRSLKRFENDVCAVRGALPACRRPGRPR